MNKDSMISCLIKHANKRADNVGEYVDIIIKELNRGGSQNHPFHIATVYGHTEIVFYTACEVYRKGSIDVRLAALIHDIGKASVKEVNPKTGYDMFRGHAKASIEFCNSNNIIVSDEIKDLVLEHDNCKSWVNGKKLGKLVRRHGAGFVDKLTTLVECDMRGQSSKSNVNTTAVENIKKWASEIEV